MGRRFEDKLPNKIAKTMVQVVETIADVAALSEFLLEGLQEDACSIIDHINDKLIAVETSGDR